MYTHKRGSLSQTIFSSFLNYMKNKERFFLVLVTRKLWDVGVRIFLRKKEGQ